jgi:hypothetical protein
MTQNQRSAAACDGSLTNEPKPASSKDPPQSHNTTMFDYLSEPTLDSLGKYIHTQQITTATKWIPTEPVLKRSPALLRLIRPYTYTTRPYELVFDRTPKSTPKAKSFSLHIWNFTLSAIRDCSSAISRYSIID